MSKQIESKMDARSNLKNTFKVGLYLNSIKIGINADN